MLLALACLCCLCMQRGIVRPYVLVMIQFDEEPPKLKNGLEVQGHVRWRERNYIGRGLLRQGTSSAFVNDAIKCKGSADEDEVGDKEEEGFFDG